VVTFDGRGNGKSDRPSEPEAYAEKEFAADALAVIDATEARRTVLVSVSIGAQRSLILTADHPERVAGAIFIAPSVPLAPPHPARNAPFDEPLDREDGWAKYNRYYWLRDYRGFLDFFFSQCFTEPHSTKQIEDAVGWGLETTAETLLATNGGPGLETKEDVLALCERIRCPVLVLHGDEDAISPHTRGIVLADATGGTLITLAGSGHLPLTRDPVRVNLLIRRFMESLA
jgi:pimeloyl-ACP methyl ester carboxylesterase